MPREQNSQSGLLSEESAPLTAAKVEHLVDADMKVNYVLLADSLDYLLNHLDHEA